MIRFGKYHGLGNDFLVVDLREVAPEVSETVQQERTVRNLCDRRFGVGGDGVLAILPAVTANADARMRVLNADGGEAEMCGNGIRCVAKHLYERDPKLARPALTIDTGAGPLLCELAIDGDRVHSVRVNMGPPRFARSEVPVEGPADDQWVNEPLALPSGTSLPITCVSMGNPHAIHFVPDGAADLRDMAESRGPEVETHSAFPNKTNAEFARVHNPQHIELVVWERGCGITFACGTGACATAAAACRLGHSEPGTPIRVSLPGGDLEIEVAADGSAAFMRGPAEHVFDSEFDPSLWSAPR